MSRSLDWPLPVMSARSVLLALVCAGRLVTGKFLLKRAASRWRAEGFGWTSVSALFSVRRPVED
jgi:hypothetical protein